MLLAVQRNEAPMVDLDMSLTLLEEESFVMAYKGLGLSTANSIPFPRSPSSVTMSSSVHTSGYPNELTGVGHSHDERYDKRSVAFGPEMMADSGLDSDEKSDINPGGLTFEEGLSL
jgi:hypothetical protein